MKKILTIVFTIFMFITLNGCAEKEITYFGNLGYDLSSIDYESIEFNIYHSNTDNHKWELLKTLKCNQKDDRFIDIRLEGKENALTFLSVYNYVEKTEKSESYFSDEIDKFEFAVEGFDGNIRTVKTYEIKDTDEEQFYRLIPVDNKYGTIFEYVSLDETYDEKEVCLDNILITIKINKNR